VPRAASHQWEPVGKSHQWRRPWEVPRPHRGQLNDQLESIERLTDRGHRSGVAVRECEVWPDGPGTFDEEPERLGGRERPRRTAAHRVGPFARDAEQGAARNQRCQPALPALVRREA
jgi:hypothetical protein